MRSAGKSLASGNRRRSPSVPNLVVFWSSVVDEGVGLLVATGKGKSKVEKYPKCQNRENFLLHCRARSTSRHSSNIKDSKYTCSGRIFLRIKIKNTKGK
jgi:hypothetical protein